MPGFQYCFHERTSRSPSKTFIAKNPLQFVMTTIIFARDILCNILKLNLDVSSLEILSVLAHMAKY